VTGRVLLLASRGLGPARAAWRLLERGFTLAGCWVGATQHPRPGAADRWLAGRNPAFSLTAALDAAGIAPRPVPRLATWDGLSAALAEAAPDLVLSLHFRWLVPPALLDRLPGRALNLHPTLLPDYRGPRGHVALLADGAGEQAGVTLHLMDPSFDGGPLVAQRRVPFRPGADAIAWELDLARAYATLIDDGLVPYLAGHLDARPQLGTGSYPRLGPRDLALHRGVPLSRARRLCEIFGQWREVAYLEGERRWRLVPPLRALGPRSGAAPRAGLFAFEADIADARVRLARRLPGHGRRLRRRRRRRWAAATP